MLKERKVETRVKFQINNKAKIDHLHLLKESVFPKNRYRSEGEKDNRVTQTQNSDLVFTFQKKKHYNNIKRDLSENF